MRHGHFSAATRAATRRQIQRARFGGGRLVGELGTS
jgi:hypothetical protein